VFSRSMAKNGPRVSTVEYPAAPYLVPLLALVGTLMLIGSFSSGGVDWLYGLRVLATAAALAYFLPTYLRTGILEWRLSWQSIAIGALVFGIWMALAPLSGADSSRELATMSGLGALTWLAFRIIGSIVTVPLAEELAFRGFLTRRLIAEDFSSVPMGKCTWLSFLISSAAFGALHDRWLAGTIAGMLFALALYRRGKVMDAVVAHATANTLLTFYVLASGNWAAWS
jgi:CAAX prenyl protease-like protein